MRHRVRVQAYDEEQAYNLSWKLREILSPAQICCIRVSVGVSIWKCKAGCWSSQDALGLQIQILEETLVHWW